jgi:hypothetical protein
MDRQCTRCGEPLGREQLHEKSVVFRPMHDRSSIARRRTVDWLCLECMSVDPDWTRPAGASPMFRGGDSFGTARQALEDTQAQ